MEWNQLIWCVPLAIGGLLIGHMVGMRNARKVRSRCVQQLNQKSLELLDAKSELLEYKKQPNVNARRERLFQLTLTKLQQANTEIRTLREQLDSHSHDYVVELSRMRLRSEEACETARKACEIAVNATLRLDKLTKKTQVTLIPEHKNSIRDESAAVNIADRARAYGATESITAVIKHDSATGLDELHNGMKASVR